MPRPCTISPTRSPLQPQRGVYRSLPRLSSPPQRVLLSIAASSKAVRSVDSELWEALEMCGDEDLRGIYAELFGPSPFSPVVKSVVADQSLITRGSDGKEFGELREVLMGKIEDRFRFLAADSLTTLRGARPSYRETLAHIRTKFDVRCAANLDTVDLEAEIFLHLLHNYRRFMLSVPDKDGAAAAALFVEGDGMALQPKRGATLMERITAPLRLGKSEVLSTVTKLGSAVTFSAMSDSIMARMSAQVIANRLKYQAALNLLCTEGVQNVRRRAAVQAAERGLTISAARFGAMRSALVLLGPVMWTWLGVDLALKSIGTDYSRVVKTVFALAQVRLLRTHGFTVPKQPNHAPA